VTDINPGANNSSPVSLTVVNGALYFQAFDAVAGVELWKTDGTETGTVRVKDINPGTGHSFPGGLAPF
jgi:ELWxxDGT repeat protein